MYFTGLAKQNYFFKLVEYIFLSPPNSTYLDEFWEKKYRYVVILLTKITPKII